jgi:chemotaxis family two-component system sensor histidine kinase/response regulator PixL
MQMPPGMSSACVLGDGKVVPLVDVGELLRWIASCSRKGDAGRGASDWGLTNANSHLGSANVAPSTLGASAQASAYPNSVPNTQSLVPSFQQVSEVTQKDIILVVDDSINVRRFLALALEKAGYLVEQAKDGQDAVEKLLGGLHCCAVICDIEMPRLDGYGFLARIKSEPAFDDLPIAMLTSRTGDKHRQLAMTLGAAAYFSKPYNEQELLRTMKQLITSSGAYSPQPVLSHEF